jgi:hypothetical protein
MVAFRDTEVAAIDTYNQAVERRSAEEISDRALGELLEREVLPPWREMRARLEGLPKEADGLGALLRYVTHREREWELQAELLSTGDQTLMQEFLRQRDLAQQAADELGKEGAARAD